MSDGLEQLANTIQTYEKRLHGCKHEPGQILQLLQNWQVPILKDFGLALEQVISTLIQVANTSEAALQLADQTFCGESLTAAAESASDLNEAMFGVDMPDEAREALTALLETLAPWAEDEDEEEEVDEGGAVEVLPTETPAEQAEQVVAGEAIAQ